MLLKEHPINKIKLFFMENQNSGPYFNMALDDYFLDLCNNNQINGMLRLYSWQPEAVSFGTFFNTSKLDRTKLQEDNIVPVRRITGGKAVLHRNDITYCLIIKKGLFEIENKRDYYVFTANILKTALEKLNMESIIRTKPQKKNNHPDCYHSISQYELSSTAGEKLIGSAQKILPGAYLQHGSFYLSPGSNRLTDYISNKKEQAISQDPGGPDNNYDTSYASMSRYFKEAFARYFDLQNYHLNDNDHQKIEQLIENKYSTNEWTYKR